MKPNSEKRVPQLPTSLTKYTHSVGCWQYLVELEKDHAMKGKGTSRETKTTVFPL